MQFNFICESESRFAKIDQTTDMVKPTSQTFIALPHEMQYYWWQWHETLGRMKFLPTQCLNSSSNQHQTTSIVFRVVFFLYICIVSNSVLIFIKFHSNIKIGWKYREHTCRMLIFSLFRQQSVYELNQSFQKLLTLVCKT